MCVASPRLLAASLHAFSRPCLSVGGCELCVTSPSALLSTRPAGLCSVDVGGGVYVGVWDVGVVCGLLVGGSVLLTWTFYRLRHRSWVGGQHQLLTAGPHLW